MDTATLEKLEHSDDGPATAKIYNYQKYLVSKELDLRWKDTYRASQLIRRRDQASVQEKNVFS